MLHFSGVHTDLLIGRIEKKKYLFSSLNSVKCNFYGMFWKGYINVSSKNLILKKDELHLQTLSFLLQQKQKNLSLKVCFYRYFSCFKELCKFNTLSRHLSFIVCKVKRIYSYWLFISLYMYKFYWRIIYIFTIL